MVKSPLLMVKYQFFMVKSIKSLFSYGFSVFSLGVFPIIFSSLPFKVPRNAVSFGTALDALGEAGVRETWGKMRIIWGFSNNGISMVKSMVNNG